MGSVIKVGGASRGLAVLAVFLIFIGAFAPGVPAAASPSVQKTSAGGSVQTVPATTEWDLYIPHSIADTEARLMYAPTSTDGVFRITGVYVDRPSPQCSGATVRFLVETEGNNNPDKPTQTRFYLSDTDGVFIKELTAYSPRNWVEYAFEKPGGYVIQVYSGAEDLSFVSETSFRFTAINRADLGVDLALTPAREYFTFGESVTLRATAKGGMGKCYYCFGYYENGSAPDGVVMQDYAIGSVVVWQPPAQAGTYKIVLRAVAVDANGRPDWGGAAESERTIYVADAGAPVKDIVYAEDKYCPDSYRLVLDVYPAVPPASATKTPAVVKVHGGSWTQYSKPEGATFIGEGLSASGVTVIEAEYRREGAELCRNQVGDIKAAIAWVYAHCADYNIDPDRVYLYGESAGAHLAMLAALTCGDSSFPPTGGAEDKAVRAMVNVVGPVNLAQLYNDAYAEGNNGLIYALEDITGTKTPPWEDYGAYSTYLKASPYKYLARSDARIVSFYGGEDVLVNAKANMNDLAYVRLRYRKDLPVHFLQGANHDFASGDNADSRFLLQEIKKLVGVG